MTVRHFALFLILLAGSATVLSACARRADLDTPTQARARAAQEAGEEFNPEDLNPPKPDRPFILDKLIE